jgi:hypothetical protein
VADSDLDKRLAPLYRDPPEDFVRQRDALAKQLREDGDRDVAARVKKLRRPSQSAWLINRVGVDEPERARDLVEAADNLATAQQRMLEEGGDASELRSAARAERERVEEMVSAARRVAAEHPKPINEAMIERVAQTLQAAGSNPDLRDQLLRGRVETDHRAATIGLPASAGPPRARPRPAAESQTAKRTRQELARLRKSLAETKTRLDAQRRVLADTEAEVRRHRLELGESESEARDLERRIAAAERRARD